MWYAAGIVIVLVACLLLALVWYAAEAFKDM
jgi:hypothetical protein